MLTSQRIVSAILVTLAAGGATVFAESTPEAIEWIDKLAAVYERAPFKFRYDADLTMSQMGQMMDVKVFGLSTQGGNGRARIETTMTMPGPGSDPDSTASVEVLGVSDGAVFWVETPNPISGNVQVIKISLAKMADLADQSALARNLSRMDPLKQIHELTTIFDFKVVGRDHQTVTLRANLTGDALEVAKDVFEGTDTSRLKQLDLVLRTDNGFPDQIRIGEPTDSVMSVRFFDLEFLDSLNEDVFIYAPPEGATVMDLGALMDAGLLDQP
jgi:hypothetical protein